MGFDTAITVVCDQQLPGCLDKLKRGAKNVCAFDSVETARTVAEFANWDVHEDSTITCPRCRATQRKAARINAA